ncbi:MAG TPA: Uma2 family endonuclease [Candidatus Baltobacteraceae bacterium]|jgi:Uma2 family endonuclease|nr:Uma2 family endonuclease [Candidatus Baltobacteraceae bacterium]
MRSVVETPKKVWTQAEVQALPEQGFNHEVVDGELVTSPKNDFFHGFISARLSAALLAFVQTERLGAVLDSSTGFWMKNRNCRAPDISFISRGRLEALGFRPSSRLFFPGAPDLAVEVLSPNNTRGEIDERLNDFFTSGSRLAWIIDSQAQRVEVCRSLTERRLIGSGGFLEGEDVLPGFHYPIANLFKEWDWE